MLNIEAIRRERKVTQQELADTVGVGRSAVAMWETGRTNPSVDKLPQIARVLGCTIEDLFGEEVQHADTDEKEIQAETE